MAVRKPRLRLSIRTGRWSRILPHARWLSLGMLVLTVIGGLYQWLLYPSGVGAILFVPHTIAGPLSSKGASGMVAGDFDGDGEQDIVTAGLDGIKIYENKGKEVFAGARMIKDIDAERVQAIDLNSDNRLDIIASLKNTSTPTLKWYRNEGGFSFSEIVVSEGGLIGTGSEALVYARDINQDGTPDVVTASDQGTINRWVNNGSGTLTSDGGAVPGVKINAITIGDLDGAGTADIVYSTDNGLFRYHQPSGGSWTINQIDAVYKNRTHLQVVDVNKDTKLDILTADNQDNVVAWYKNSNNTSWERIALPGNMDATSVKLSDFDKDTDNDVLVAAQDDGSIYLYTNDGNNTFTRSTLATKLDQVFDVAAADFNGDGGLDFTTSNHLKGIVYWYERTHVKPKATTPTSIEQSTNGTGHITFETTVSDADSDTTQLRVQYSLDGTTWYKPWLTAVSTSVGKANLRNSDGYQIGTSDPIDTDVNASVKVKLTWDTKSTKNTGGAIKGAPTTVKLRVIPRDAFHVGDTVTSGSFRVDNQSPHSFTPWEITAVSSSQVSFKWKVGTDGSPLLYRIYYATDELSVLEQRAPLWDGSDDSALDKTTTTGTTITDIEPKELGYPFGLLKEVAAINDQAQQLFLQKIEHALWITKGKKLAVWGLSFKANTDDMRNAPSIPVIERLVHDGAMLVAYDPQATHTAKQVLGNKIEYATDMYEPLKDADALIILTDWEEFKEPNWKRLRQSLKNPIIIDGRNLYSPAQLSEQGFVYHSVGRS